MLQLFQKLLNDEQGFVITSELVLITTILCLAMVVGLTDVSQSASDELIDVTNAYSQLNQGRRYQSLGWGDNS